MYSNPPGTTKHTNKAQLQPSCTQGHTRNKDSPKKRLTQPQSRRGTLSTVTDREMTTGPL